MGMFAIRSGCRQAVRAALALAASAALALACALPAAADEAGGQEKDSFDLNLRMDVADVADPDAPAHPVTVTVVGDGGEPVAGAKIAYVFVEPNPEYYVPPEADVPAGEYAAAPLAEASGTMALSGEAVCDGSGRARVEGIVRGCDYEVRATAEGYRAYVGTHTCKGLGSEAWEVVMEKMPAGGGEPGGSGGSGGTTVPGGSGSSGGSGSGSGFGGGSGSAVPFPWLAVTGDAALPWLLALSGAVLSGFALVALARRRRKDGADA